MTRCSVSWLDAALVLALGCGDGGDGASAGSTSTVATSAGSSGDSSGVGTLEPTGAGPTGTGLSGESEATGTPVTSSTTADTTTGEDTSGTATTGPDACADSILTWENFGQPFMLTWCTGCHNSALPTAQRSCAPCYANFDNHAGVALQAAVIGIRTLDPPPDMKMPPAAIIPEDELAMLREYIDCGAPGPDAGKPPLMCPDPEVMTDCP